MEIANQINKSVRTVKTYMAEMQEKGLIERKNGKKNGKWQVNAWYYKINYSAEKSVKKLMYGKNICGILNT